jgi:Uma2 family endonuclease
MSTGAAKPDTLANVVHALGDVPIPRIIWSNLGSATEIAQLDLCGRLKTGQNRLPDISFTAWANLPSADADLQRVGTYAPDLAVEILSEGITPGEMARKRREYFAAGCMLVWIIDPDARTVEVFANPTQPDRSTLLHGGDTLGGGSALPGYTLPLADLFDDPQLNPHP